MEVSRLKKIPIKLLSSYIIHIESNFITTTETLKIVRYKKNINEKSTEKFFVLRSLLVV